MAGITSQEQFARAIDMSTRRLATLETTPQVEVFPSTLFAISRALNKSEDEVKAVLCVPADKITPHGKLQEALDALSKVEGLLTAKEMERLKKRVASMSPDKRERVAKKKRERGQT
jgi:transcriptional regulator with XRE-family HTH domain